MKTLFVVVASLLLLWPAPGHAQEADASPTEKLDLRSTDPFSETAPSISVPTESSSEYPKPGTPLETPAPSPSPAPRATASPKKAPSPAKVASPAPVATPTAAPSKSSVAATIKDFESRWATAIAQHDLSVPQALLAEDYIGVNSTGRVVNKSTLIAEMKRDKNTYTSAVNSGLTVRVLGDAAVVVGTTKQSGKDASGKPFTYLYRWTDTWALRNGQWQCVASQSFVVSR